MSVTILETERLILRPWTEDDAEELYKYACDPDVGPAAGWPPHTSVENSRDIISTVLSASETYAVCLKDRENLLVALGCIVMILQLMRTNTSWDIGSASPFGGQGLIPEASREILRYSFETLKMNRIWCGYYDGNEKSRRVQEKLGFIYQRMTEGIEVKQLNEMRTGHSNLMTKGRWKTVELFRRQKTLLDTFLEKMQFPRHNTIKALAICEKRWECME